MKAEELRIDNLVEYNGIICKVSEIRSPKPFEDERFSGKFIIELFDGAGLITCTIDDIKPIMLSEEKLLELGFDCFDELDNANKNYYKTLTCNFWIQEHTDVNRFFCYSYKNSDTLCIIEYVHQLQNLTFALSGEELTIK